tara:strand:- start:3652 stop:4890 length:1239 start_codon:yes stop_codon:yes gene_type:complete
MVILGFIGIYHFKGVKSKIEKYFLYFLVFWFLYALGFYFFVAYKADAKIDIRSLLLMLITTWNILWVKSYIGFKNWISSLKIALTIIFIILVLFSLFEYITGIHFTGNFTDRLLLVKYFDSIYSPVFLFDNPNNVAVYVIVISALLFLIEMRLKKRISHIILLMFTDLFISILTFSRFGMFLSVFLIFAYLVLLLPHFFFYLNKNKRLRIYVVVSILMMVILYIKTPKYYGPIWNKNAKIAEKIDGINTEINTENHLSKLEDFETVNTIKERESYDSKRVRKALFFNGLEMLAESNYIGVGPGQFRGRHKNNEVIYYTKTNVSPHFWAIEILSQYGMIIFGIYLFFIGWIIVKSFRVMKSHFFYGSIPLITLFIFAVCSLMPSSFLILDINWIFVAVMIGFISKKYSVDEVE